MTMQQLYFKKICDVLGKDCGEKAAGLPVLQIFSRGDDAPGSEAERLQELRGNRGVRSAQGLRRATTADKVIPGNFWNCLYLLW